MGLVLGLMGSTPAASSLIPTHVKLTDTPSPASPILRKSTSRALSSKVMGTGALVPGEPVRRLEGSEVLPPARPGPQGLPISQTERLAFQMGTHGLFQGFPHVGVGGLGVVAAMGVCGRGARGSVVGARGGAW